MSSLEQAILDTLAYADIFQYPLAQDEIHRYLVGVKAALTEVCAALDHMQNHGLLDCRDGFYTLPGRSDLVSIRQARRQTAARLWPNALQYGKLISYLPFVRMVAVTGSLAVNNVEPQADLDYLIVTRPGRVWLARLMVILLVRWAATRGSVICPNYFLSETSLALPERDLFTAHELVQMVPISGAGVYAAMRRLNAWVTDYLPNASLPWWAALGPAAKPPLLQKLGELVLQAPIFDRLERWEMERKIRKFAKLPGSHLETCFDAETCKGHFDAHENQVLSAFQERERILQEEVQ